MSGFKLGWVIVGAVVVAGLTGCGGDSGRDERDPITQVFTEMSVAVEEGRSRQACAHLALPAREQVGLTGQYVFQDCVSAMGPLLASLKRSRPKGPRSAPPAISGIELNQSAIVTVDVDGRSIKVPFVKEGGTWKMNSFYGLDPVRSLGLQ